MYRLAYERMGVPRWIVVFGGGKVPNNQRGTGCAVTACNDYSAMGGPRIASLAGYRQMVSPALLFIIRTDERVGDGPVPLVCPGHRAESVSAVNIRANDRCRSRECRCRDE